MATKLAPDEDGLSEYPITYSSRPVPDPTVLTTQQLLRELGSTREILEARLTGMDRAILLIQQAADKSPTISEVVAKMEERFKSIETQFTERDVRTDQTARDSKVGIDAALSAAKEAVSKAQDATTKQIDSILAALAAASKAADDKITSVMAILEQTKQGIDSKIDDVKGRVGSIESRGKGIQDIGLYLAIGVAIVILGLTFLLKH